MVEKKFKIGDNVRITGKVVSIGADSIGVKIDGEQFVWSIFSRNAELIKPRKKLETPKYYNGKVVCVKSEFTRDFTVGKVYEFVDGVVKDNRGATRFVGHRITDLNEIKGTWQFIPFVEDEDKSLSVEELLAMDGQKVWLVSLDENKNPYTNNRLGGWHTVDAKNDKLIDGKDDFFYIHDSNTAFGFIAYRTAPRK